MSIEIIATAITQLGVAGIFVWLYIRKDDDQKKMTSKLIESYTENTKVQEGLKNSLDNNTKVLEENKSLTQKIHEELLKGK